MTLSSQGRSGFTSCTLNHWTFDSDKKKVVIRKIIAILSVGQIWITSMKLPERSENSNRCYQGISR